MDGRILRFVLLGALIGPWPVRGGPAAIAAAPAAPAELVGTLGAAHFRAGAFAYHFDGRLLWLAGPQGLLRLEVGRGAGPDGAAADVTDLLQQRGQGWTAILGGPGDDTVNAWGESWRKPPPGLRQAAHLVTAALVAGPPVPRGSAGEPWRAAAGAAPTERAFIDPLVPDRRSLPRNSGFHNTLSGRGLGRGGSGEVLAWRWVGTGTDQPMRLRVRSTRRPGRVELAPAGTRAVRYAMPEAFVPLWPLAQLLEFSP